MFEQFLDPNKLMNTGTGPAVEPGLTQKQMKIQSLCGELSETLIRKNHDYGDSVHDTYMEYGPVSFLVRIADKINRIKELSGGTDPVVGDEKLKDTVMDLAGYAILFAAELE